ncbi:hypothetical protein JY460_05570 [Stenotrophomonas maltophilia]|nr:hypothetical protein [Stenotrophomonas maltophilia]
MSNDNITAAAREPYDAMGPIDAPNPPAARATLADVQPGGRVRLGDQAERTRFEAWAESEGWYAVAYRPDRDAPYALNAVEFAWQAWQAALSAQPSPGGQDALDCIGRIEEAIEFRVPHDIYAAVHGELAELKAALAARQPSKQPDSVALGEATEFCIENGARQPVGQKAVVISHWRDGELNHILYCSPMPDGVHRLYAAPPAQAVDLGQFRAKVAEFLRSEFDLEVADPEDHRHDDGSGEADRIAGNIVALLDSQAVGK